MKEILDVYNNKFELTGKTIERGKKELSKNEYIMLAVVFIKNSDEKYLIQKTSKDKGNIFSSTGGHVLHNENPIEAIVREIKEELNLTIKKQQLKFIDKVILEGKPCIFNLYVLECDFDVRQIKMQEEEVESLQWLDASQIVNLIKENEFLKSHGELFKIVNHLK
jgi:8-oxo-dGTP pyrophosphatase MutT (NUDIX family)